MALIFVVTGVSTSTLTLNGCAHDSLVCPLVIVVVYTLALNKVLELGKTNAESSEILIRFGEGSHTTVSVADKPVITKKVESPLQISTSEGIVCPGIGSTYK